MHVVTVTFRIAPGREAEFLPLIRENARLSLSEEPGCLRFDVCLSPDDAGEVFLHEVYTDRDAFAAHRTMAHYLDFSQKSVPMVASKIVKTYDLDGRTP